jgi:hypothetical protein
VNKVGLQRRITTEPVFIRVAATPDPDVKPAESPKHRVRA